MFCLAWFLTNTWFSPEFPTSLLHHPCLVDNGIFDTLITMYQGCFSMDSPFLMGCTFKKVWKKSSARNDDRTYSSNQEKCKPEHKNTFSYSGAKLSVLYEVNTTLRIIWFISYKATHSSVSKTRVFVAS